MWAGALKELKRTFSPNNESISSNFENTEQAFLIALYNNKPNI
jgi:hypothetical protein